MAFHSILKEGFRRLRRSPRLSVAVVLCIALGMAAVATVATLVSLTGIRALPFPEAERLVRVWNSERSTDAGNQLAWVDFTELQAGMNTLERMEAAARSRLVWHLPSRPGRRVEGEAVSAGYFDLLGVEPYLGRLFTPEEHSAGDSVILLSHQTWGREFAYADDIIGRTIRTDAPRDRVAATYTVIGVLPPDFYGTVEVDMPDLEFWIPINSYYPPEVQHDRERRGTWAIARLAVGASLAAAQEEADAVAEALAPQFASFSPEHGYRVERLGANWRAGYKQANGLLAGAAALLLAVAVFNVAMLLVARTLERRHELALRTALGADRRALMLPVLVETLLLAAIGGAIGFAVALPLLEGFLTLSGAQIPTYLAVRPDAVALGVSFAVMLLAGTAAALLPAWAGTGVAVHDSLGGGSGRLAGSRSASRWGRWLVGGEVALTLALLLAGALLCRSYLALENRDVGFADDNRLRMALFVSPADVPEESALPAFANRMEAALRAETGVLDVALLWPTLPLPSPVVGRLTWPGMTRGEGDQGLRVSYYVAHQSFFSGLDIPLIAGRTFEARDAEAGRRTAVVGRSLADRLGGPAAALEREVTLDGADYRIVGVVGNIMSGGPRESADFHHEIYLSFAQLPGRTISPIVHVAGEPSAYVEPLKQALADVAPASVVDWVEVVDEFLAWLYRDSAFQLAIVAAFALGALLLATIGLYAVLAQQVSAASTEIGIRKALGASDRRILGRVLGRGMAITLAGLGVGFAIALAFSRVLAGLLYGVGLFDPVAYGVAGGMLLAVAALACLLPARRAARVAPMEALRRPDE